MILCRCLLYAALKCSSGRSGRLLDQSIGRGFRALRFCLWRNRSHGKRPQNSQTGSFEIYQSFLYEYLTRSAQFYLETNEPLRTKFIGRKLSYHGNSIATLALAHHPARRAPYEAILDHETFHHVSPAYAKRFMLPNETEDQYVQRLADELEAKFQELGPDKVIGCKSIVILSYCF